MKITSRQLGGYLMAKKEWISENDAYNKQRFGITREQYFKINRAISDMMGIGGGIPSLSALNRRLGG